MGFDFRKLPETDVLVDVLEGRLHALSVCLSNSWGGLEQVAASDAIDAGAKGLDVRVLCLAGSPIHERLSSRKEVKVVPLSFRPRNNMDFKLRKELRRLTDGEAQINLIHTHQTSLLGSISPWLWRRPKVALFATRHLMNNHDKSGFYHGLIYRRLDSMLAISAAVKRNILDTHPLPERRIRTLNLGLDFDRFDPRKVDPVQRRAQWGADDETTVIGLVGRIDPAKGQATFLRAAAGLLKRMGSERARETDEKLKFVIVGAETIGNPSGHLAELKAMVDQFRIGEHVVFAGFEDNIPEVMSAFDLFAMPSRQEAFGLVAIEAMAMRCPVVISSGGSAAEIVGDDEYGLTVRPEDAFDLQRRLRTLIDQPELREKMGEAGRAYVIANFDRASRLQRTLALYEWALKRRGM